MNSSVAAQISEAQISEAMDAQTEAFRADVLAGLAKLQKTLPSRWLYDDHGSELFEKITKLPEYYPTRTETAILNDNADALAEFCGRHSVVIEYGAGASVKSQILLAALQHPRMYVPVDIAGDFLAMSAERLRRKFSALEVMPVAADFTELFDLPQTVPVDRARTGIFLGSTLGNLSTSEAASFLQRVRRHVGQAETIEPHNGRALIGIDLRKSTSILIPAYDDAAGVTAEFNLNLLERINRELDGTFDLAHFAHEARWNEQQSAIEMHIVSSTDQRVTVAGETFSFGAGETVHTESSRKYSLDGFSKLARQAGWSVEQVWTDETDLFAIVGLANVQTS